MKPAPGILFFFLAVLAADTARAVALPGPAEGAAFALERFARACALADGHWAVPLCGPVVLVDPQTRLAVANQPDPGREFAAAGAVFIGRWPDHNPVANTAVEWDGEYWAMAMLPVHHEPFEQLRLLAHESFHRIQPALGLSTEDPHAAHLDELEGRLWLRLELRALAQALDTDDTAARAAATDALAFRAWRQSRFAGSAASERMLEANEGLAEYAGTRFALDATGDPVSHVARSTRRFEERRSYVRSLGYGTGPALGLLLDRYLQGWRDGLEAVPALADMLADALGFDALAVREAPVARAAAYGYDAVHEEERTRATEREALLAHYRARLVDGPVLELRGTSEFRYGFDPNSVVPMGERGTVFPTAFFMDAWGTLRVERGGALMSPERDRVLITAPTTLPRAGERELHGDGWVLELAPGWRVVAGNTRGDFRLAKVPDS
jgi:hypothetical protein